MGEYMNRKTLRALLEPHDHQITISVVSDFVYLLHATCKFNFGLYSTFTNAALQRFRSLSSKPEAVKKGCLADVKTVT